MRRWGFPLCLAVALAACSHEQPFETPESGTDTPFAPGAPSRLTYNPGLDLWPAWLPDGSGFLYTWQQAGTPVQDRCIATLPASGGTQTSILCNPDPAYADSADHFEVPSPSPDGRLLYVRGASRAGAASPGLSWIFIGPMTQTLGATPILSLPYTIPGGRMHGAMTTARWRGPTSLVYVGQSRIYARECSNCPLDTLSTGLEIVEMDLSGATPILAVLPGTYGASSADLDASGDTLYFTLNDDSRVYRRAFSSGQVDVVHDFGVRGIARDVTVHGTRLVAVVGGDIYFVTDSVLGPLQPDGGGPLVSVDLTTGTESVLPTDSLIYFRRPAFAPAGATTRLVAEGYPPLALFPTRHQYVSKLGDLYLFEAP